MRVLIVSAVCFAITALGQAQCTAHQAPQPGVKYCGCTGEAVGVQVCTAAGPGTGCQNSPLNIVSCPGYCYVIQSTSCSVTAAVSKPASIR